MTLTFCNGTVLHREQCRPVFGDWFDAIVEFSVALHNIDLDLSAMACLEALTLITGKVTNSQESNESNLGSGEVIQVSLCRSS